MLVATGRRSIEILKTGDFTLEKTDDINGYSCIFSGQAKTGLEDCAPYRIPLLAPYRLVNEARNVIRETLDCTQMNSEQVNLSYAKSLNAYSKKKVGINAHGLRAVYAHATHRLFGPKKSAIGWTSRVLGHARSTNGTFYQHFSCTNIQEPFQNEENEENEPDDIKEEASENDWNFDSLSEAKKVLQLHNLIMRRIPITASAIRRELGGSMMLIQRIIQKNLARIDKYDASLEK